MKEADFSKLDFDSMTAIAKESPSEFERLRQQAIDELIESAPPERQARLRGLQWRIDQERRNRTPLSACIRISKMMWDQLMESGGFLGPRIQDDLTVETHREPVQGKVLSFPSGGGRRQ
jgi:hypothetical protein